MGTPSTPSQMQTTNQTQSGVSTYAPTAAAYNAYQAILNQVPGLPQYQNYQGQLVAPVNAQQQAGIAGLNEFAYGALPYLNTAAQFETEGATPLTPQDINNYYSPYQQQVVQATQDVFNQQNKQALNNITGNAAAQGALGGDRVGVADAAYYSGVAPVQGAQIAGLENTGYNAAVQLAMQQKQLEQQGGYGIANVGSAFQNAALTGANAQIGAGTLEQQTAQALDQALIQQYMSPYTQLAAGANIVTGVGQPMGGTNTGFQTGYGTNTTYTNPWNQYAGLGIAALGALAKDGGRIGYADGGSLLSNPFLAYTPVQRSQVGPSPVNFTPLTFAKANGTGSLAKDMESYGNAFEGAGNLWDKSQGWSTNDNATPGGGGNLSASETLGPEDFGESFEAFGGRVGYQDGGDVNEAAPLGLAGVDDVGEAAPIGLANNLAVARSRYNDELTPAAKERLFRLTEAEVGGQPGVAQPFLESVFNRGLARNQSLMQAANDSGYYPRVSLVGRRPTDRGVYQTALDNVLAGSNVSKYATGNASGSVGFAGGPQTYVPGTGERFGIEGPDRPWSSALAFADTQGGQSDLPPEVTQGVSRGLPVNRQFAGLNTNGELPPGEEPTATRSGLLGLNLSEKNRNFLMSLGAGMAASDSLSFGQAVGKGLLGAIAQQDKQKALQLGVDRLRQQIKNENARTGILQEQSQIARERLEQEQWVPQLDQFGMQTGNFYNKKNPTQVITADEMKRRIADKSAKDSTAPKTTAPAPDTTALTPVPGKTFAAGEVPEHIRWSTDYANKPYDYSKLEGYPSYDIPQGTYVPDPASIGSGAAAYSGSSIKAAAARYLLEGKEPPLRTGKGMAVLHDMYRKSVINYANALMDSSGMTKNEWAELVQSAPKVAQWMVGQDGRTITALGTVIHHLNTLQDLGDAYYEGTNTGNWQTWNRLKAKFAQEFGDKAATSAIAGSQLVGVEIMKAMGAAGAGSEGERLKAAGALDIASGITQDQLRGNIATAKRFLAAQMAQKESQAHGIGLSKERFKKMVGERAYEELDAARKETGETKPTGNKPKTVEQNGHTYTLQPDGTYK